MDRKTKAGVAILISEKKKDFKTKDTKRDTESLHNTEGKNPTRRPKHCKPICNQYRTIQIQMENLEGLQERYRQQHTNTRGF